MLDLVAFAYGVSITLIALALFLFWLSTSISAILLGPLIDRKRLHVGGMALGILVLSLGLLLSSVALAGFSVAFFLITSSVVAGFGSSFYHPTGAYILQTHYTGGHTGRYLGVNGSAGSLGRAAYPTLLLLVGAALASNVLSVQVFGILGVVLATVVFFGVRGYDAGREGEFDADPKAVAPAKGDHAIGSALTPGLALLTSISFVRSLAFYGIVSFIPEYITFVRGAGAGLSLGALTTLMFSGGIFGQLFFGRLVEDHDRRLILTTSTILSALLLYAYLETSGTASLVALALFGFTNFAGFPIFMSMVSDYAPKKTSTTGNAVVWNLGNTGGRAAGPLLIGAIAAEGYSHLPFAFEVSLIAALVAALVTLRLPKPAATSKATLVG